MSCAKSQELSSLNETPGWGLEPPAEVASLSDSWALASCRAAPPFMYTRPSPLAHFELYVALATTHAPHGLTGQGEAAGTARVGGAVPRSAPEPRPRPWAAVRVPERRAPPVFPPETLRAHCCPPAAAIAPQKTSGAMSSPPEGKLETKAGHPPAGTDWFALCLRAPGGGGAGSGSRGPISVRCAGAQVSGPGDAGKWGAGSSTPRQGHLATSGVTPTPRTKPSYTSQNSNVGNFYEIAQMFWGRPPNN